MDGVAAAESTGGFGEGVGEGIGCSPFPALNAGGGWPTGLRVGGAAGAFLGFSDSPTGLGFEDGDICREASESVGRARNSRVARTAAVSITKRGWVLNLNESSA